MHWHGAASATPRTPGAAGMTARVTAPPGRGRWNRASGEGGRGALPLLLVWGGAVFLTVLLLLFMDKDINAQAEQMLRGKR